MYSKGQFNEQSSYPVRNNNGIDVESTTIRRQFDDFNVRFLILHSKKGIEISLFRNEYYVKKINLTLKICYS